MGKAKDRETASHSLLSHICAQKCAQLIAPLQLMQVFSEQPLRNAEEKDLGRRAPFSDQA